MTPRIRFSSLSVKAPEDEEIEEYSEDDISDVEVEKPARDSDMESEAMNDEDIPDREDEEAIEADSDPHPPPVMVYSTEESPTSCQVCPP
jgi:hypothetical protein